MTRALLVLLVAPALLSCVRTATPAEPPPAVVVPAPTDDQPNSPPASDANGPISPQEALRLCEHYRRAVEQRDIEALLALVSPDYHDDAGTPDPADDLDAAGMRSYLERTFSQAQAVRYELDVREVAPDGDRAIVRFAYRAEYGVAGSETTQRMDQSEMTIERRDGKLLIVSGM